MDQHWRRPPEPYIIFEDFDEFSVVFCAAGGETHVLDAFPTEILRHLPAGKPVSFSSLIVGLTAVMDDSEDQLGGQIKDTLLALERMQVVESFSP